MLRIHIARTLPHFFSMVNAKIFANARDKIQYKHDLKLNHQEECFNVNLNFYDDDRLRCTT